MEITVDDNIDDLPSIERIPTAREFRSFDSSSDESTTAAHRYEVDESSLAQSDSYDVVGIGGVASEDSGPAYLWGSQEDDEDCDWVADSFDRYDQRQVGAAKQKTKCKKWRKSAYLADEDDYFIEESRVKQSMKNSPKIFSPPSMKDFSYDDDDEDDESIPLADRRKKDVSKEIAAIAKRIHEKGTCKRRGDYVCGGGEKPIIKERKARCSFCYEETA